MKRTLPLLLLMAAGAGAWELQWNPQSGAAAYVVQELVGTNWTTRGMTNGTNWALGPLPAGVHTYAVASSNGVAGVGDRSASLATNIPIVLRSYLQASAQPAGPWTNAAAGPTWLVQGTTNASQFYRIAVLKD